MALFPFWHLRLLLSIPYGAGSDGFMHLLFNLFRLQGDSDVWFPLFLIYFKSSFQPFICYRQWQVGGWHSLLKIEVYGHCVAEMNIFCNEIKVGSIFPLCLVDLCHGN